MNDISVKVTKYCDRRNWTMYYVDPVTEKIKTRSARTADKKGALKRAGEWEAELRSGRQQADDRISWKAYRDMYEESAFPDLGEKTCQSRRTVFNHLEKLINPRRLRSLTGTVLAEFKEKLRAAGAGDATINGQMAHLRAVLSWAVKKKLLREMPDIDIKRPKGQRLMRGRPITAEEFDRMLESVPKVRPNDAESWQYYLVGLWWSGLRLEESLSLSWDAEEPFSVDLTGKHPRFQIYAEAQKSGRDELLPMTPDFAEFVLRAPESERHGLVFKITGAYTGEPISTKRMSRNISDIGRAANVVVNKAAGKFASAHDLRRAFGTRWAKRVTPAILQRLMRHRTIETTMRYYVDLDADDIAATLWSQHAVSPTINTFINSRG